MLIFFSDPDKFEILQYKDAKSIKSSQYDPSKPVKILVHGFVSEYRSPFPQNVKNGMIFTFLQSNCS